MKLNKVPFRWHPTELVELAALKPHPRNYKTHPEGQIAHLTESLKQHGGYRNVVVARDGTILAGHGVVEAAKKIGVERLPVVRLDLEPNDTAALKVLTGDNELARFADADDRALSELLKMIHDDDPLGLLGTGYDAQQLAALVMVTRPASEIRDADAAAEWVGMPEYDEGDRNKIQLVITFESKEDRMRFCDLSKLKVATAGTLRVWAARWPDKGGRADPSAIRFDIKQGARA